MSKILTQGQIKRNLTKAIIKTGTVIYNGTKIGKGLETGHNVTIRERNKIGNNVLIGVNTYLGPGNNIGDNVRIHTSCFLEGVTLEDNVIVAPHVVFTNDRFPPCKKCVEEGKVYVGRNTVIGANVTVLPGVTVGRNCLIGAGTVVTKNIRDNSVIIGNPGKVLRVNKKHVHK